MKLYYYPVAPNPTRVRTYIAEKGIEIEQVLVDFTKAEQRSEVHRARNPAGTVPVLELDNGSYLTESLPIIEYLEELYRVPVMIGTNARERAVARSWERKIEFDLMNRIIRLVHATNSPIGAPANPTIADFERARLPEGLACLDEKIGDNRFVLGSSTTIADCTLFAALYFAEFGKITIAEEYKNVNRWYKEFKSRPTAIKE
jgi:glutathione S-transferase